jgi:hypothetical protein
MRLSKYVSFRSPKTIRIVVFAILLVATSLGPMLVPAPIRAVTDCSPNGIKYAGANWLKGAGVNVCNPGSGGYNYVHNMHGASTLSGSKWQCVEMVNRLYLTRGWTTAFWQGNGNTLVNHMPQGLTRHNNRSVSSINPGDVITLDNGALGHAAIVNSVAMSGGRTTITIINQNTQQVGSSAYIAAGSLANGNAYLKMNSWDGYLVQAVIHSPGSGTTTPGVIREDGAGLHWYLRNTNNGGPANLDFIYGRSATDTGVAGDWDGNGTTTPGVVRKDGAGWRWYLRNSSSGGAANHDFIYGLSSDIPIVGDWDGNGSVTAGIVRRDEAGWRWHLRNSNSGGPADINFAFGVYATDTPVTGDWDGNGTTTIGVYRAGGAGWHWYQRNANSAGPASADFLYGLSSTDKPIAGDWDGNKTVTPGVIRPDGAGLRWHLRNANSGGAANSSFIYGLSASDSGIVGDWDGI